MFLQITLIIEHLITHITWVLRLLFVCAQVTDECSTKSKCLVTHITCVLIPFSMYSLLVSLGILLRKKISININNIKVALDILNINSKEDW